MLPDKNSIRSVSLEELQLRQPTLIDVRSPEAFEEGHIPQAQNICVYEVGFTDSVETAFPDKRTEIAVYGESKHFNAAFVAADRLIAAGYTKIRAFAGGLEEWTAAGEKLESQTKQEPETSTGRYTLDLEKSRVRWIGRNLTNQHNGRIPCLNGFLEIGPDGLATAGEVEVDMKRMSCSDISDTKLAGMLIAHLESIDFFDAKNHPTARFSLDRFFRDPAAFPGSPNSTIEGQISIRGKVQPLALESTLSKIESGYVLQTQFDLDRTLFGAVYGSGRFFERLGMHLVNDLVNIQVTAFFQRRDRR